MSRYLSIGSPLTLPVMPPSWHHGRPGSRVTATTLTYTADMIEANEVVRDQRASGISIIVTLILWAVGIAAVVTLLAVRVTPPVAVFVGVLLLLFPLLSFVRWVMFRLVIDSHGVQVIRTLVFRAQDSLELSRIEGVGIQQGPFGRAFDYGRLSISGVGIRQLRTEPISRPHEVAREISDLIPRP